LTHFETHGAEGSKTPGGVLCFDHKPEESGAPLFGAFSRSENFETAAWD